MTANKKATMQQLIEITGLSEYALEGDGQDYSMPPFTLPQLAFRSAYSELEYENGQMGHKITIKGNSDWSEHNRYCNMNGNYEFPESLFTWTGVARDVVTVPDDAVLSDWGQMLEARAEVVVEDQWILDAGWQPVCSNPWVVIDRENNYIFEIPPMMPERDAKGIGNLLCTAPQLYAALKSARELLSRIYLDDRFDYNHVALEIMNANAALAKAVGKGGENGSI